MGDITRKFSNNILADGKIDATDGLVGVIPAANVDDTTLGSAAPNVVLDLTPQLGGNLDVNGNSIVSVSNGNISITPDGTGKIVLDGLSFPTSDGTTGQFLKTDGAGNLSFDTVNTTFTIDADGGTPDVFTTGGTLTFSGGTGISTSVSNDNIEISGTDASTSAKGIAQFDANDFAVASGTVTLQTERIQDVAGGMFTGNTETLITVTYQDADGTVDFVVDNNLANYDNTTSDFATVTGNETLENKTISLSSNTVSGSLSDFNTALVGTDFVSLDGSETLTSKTINGPDNTITNIANTSLSNSTIAFADESSTTTSIDLGQTLLVTGGEGIDTTISGATLTVSGEDASTSNKGVASFSSDNFSVSSGAVTIKDGGVANEELVNSSFNIADDTSSIGTISLGETLKVSGTSNEIETAISGDTLTIGLPNDVTVGNDLIVTGNLTVNGTTTTVNTTNTTIEDNLIVLNSGIASNESNANDIGLFFNRGSTGNPGVFVFDESENKFAVGISTSSSVDGTEIGNFSYTAATLLGNLEGNVTGNVTGNLTGNVDGNVTAGNIQVGVTGNNEIDTSSGNLILDSVGGTVEVDDNMDIAGALQIKNTGSLIFEGATDDSFETTLTVADPNADQTVTLPNATGTVLLDTATQAVTNKSFNGANNTFTNLPNTALTNDSVTIGSTEVELGQTVTDFSGLGTVTATTFSGALTGNASTATALQSSRNINGVSFNGTANINTFANLQTATGDGSTLQFSATGNGGNVNAIFVFINGVCQQPTADYTLSGSNVLFVEAPAAGDKIQIRY